MKLFYTRKQFQRVLEKIKQEYEEKVEKWRKYAEEILFQKDKLEKDYIVLKNDYDMEIDDALKTSEIMLDQSNQIKQLEKDKRQLRKQFSELEEKLSEAERLLSQRYILKELKPEKAKNTQRMKTRSNAKQSSIIKKVKE